MNNWDITLINMTLQDAHGNTIIFPKGIRNKGYILPEDDKPKIRNIFKVYWLGFWAIPMAFSSYPGPLNNIAWIIIIAILAGIWGGILVYWQQYSIGKFTRKLDCLDEKSQAAIDLNSAQYINRSKIFKSFWPFLLALIIMAFVDILGYPCPQMIVRIIFWLYMLFIFYSMIRTLVIAK